MASSSPNFRPAGLRRHFLHVHENRAVVTVLLALMTVLVSGLGWAIHLKPATVPELSKFLAEVVSSFARDPSKMTGQGELISIGNLLGLLTTISGAFLIASATLGQTLSNWWTKRFRSGHTLVIGQSPLALHMAHVFQDRGEYVQHVAPEVDWSAVDGPSRSLTIGYNAEALLRHAGLARARRLIIDAGGDAATIALAKPIYAKLERLRPPKMPDIALRISDTVLIDALSDTIRTIAQHVRRPVIFNENHIIAQDALAHLPLFRVASALGQKRVHALIIGFGDLGQRLFDQVMLTSVAGRLEPPLVTVIDRQASDCENIFRATRPAVMSTLDVEMIELDVGRDPLDDGNHPLGLAKLLARDREVPVTAVFIALSSTADTLKALMLLRRIRERQDLLKVPVFHRSRAEEGDADVLSESWSEEAPDKGCLPMPLTDEALYEQIAEPEKRTALARRLHEVYRRGPNVSKDADYDWDNLKETYRRANIHAADHLPAKLWTLGIGAVSERGELVLSSEDQKTLARLSEAGGDDPQIQALARVEHERWMVERKLDGWRYANIPKSDPVRKLHPLIVQWAQLQKQPFEIEKDVQQVLVGLGSFRDSFPTEQNEAKSSK